MLAESAFGFDSADSVLANQLSLPFHEQRCLAQRPQHVQDLLVKHEHKS